MGVPTASQGERAGGRSERGRTAWSWVRDTPLRAFIRTETGSATLLLAAAVLALVWVAIGPVVLRAACGRRRLSLRLGGLGIGQDLRGWVNNGLMTFFFFVIGLGGASLHRHRRPARAEPGAAAAAGRRRRHGSPRSHLSGRQRGRLRCPRLGHRHVDRHRLCPGPAVPGRGHDRSARCAPSCSPWSWSTTSSRCWSLRCSTAMMSRLTPLLLVHRGLRAGAGGAAARVRRGSFYFVLGVVVWIGLFVSGLDPLIVGLAWDC